MASTLPDAPTLLRLRTRQLLLLAQLGRERHLGRAAGALGVSQPAATKLLQQLEAAVGSMLFERGPRGMRPTPSGEVLIRYAQQLLTDFGAAREEMRALAAGDSGAFSDVEVAMMDLARKLAADSASVTQHDVDRLRRGGLRDDEIFDVVATAAARCFFAKLCDALGAEPDSSFLELEEELRDRLTVGRPISSAAAERLEEDRAA